MCIGWKPTDEHQYEALCHGSKNGAVLPLRSHTQGFLAVSSLLFHNPKKETMRTTHKYVPNPLCDPPKLDDQLE